MVEQETLLAHEESVEDQPAPGKAIAGKSPTQIALRRLRQDKVALVCTVVIVFLVLVAAFAPLITRAFGIYWDVSDPKAPNTTDVLAFDGYPKIGPPFNSLHLDHPLGVAPRKGYDNLAYLVYGLRTSLMVALLATIVSTFIGIALGLIAASRAAGSTGSSRS